MKIGDFARLGQVSVRMLRNYDELGLLVPAHVDPWTNYRSYTAGQLARLNRIVALKDLGFSLEAVGRLLDADLSAEQLRGMLAARRSELAQELRSTTARLAAVEVRLRLIEGEQHMSEREFVVKSLPALRVAEKSVMVNSQSEIGERVGPLFGEVYGAIRAAGAEPGVGISYYVVQPDGMECHAGFGYSGEPAAGFDVTDLPATEAVTQVHLGSMATIGESWQAFGAWLEEQGAEPAGISREIYLETPEGDEDAWVTELQLPFVRH